jgi:hypothetical protein
VTEQERFIAVMHHEKADRIPFWEMGFWDETLIRWYNEGLPLAETSHENLRNLHLDWGFPMINIAIAEFPLAEIEVLDETEERALYRDEYGRVGWH